MKKLLLLSGALLALSVLPTTSQRGVLASNTSGAIPSVRGQIWVTNKTLNTVTVYDAASGTVRAVIQVGTTPIGVIIPKGTGKAYVSDEGSNNVKVIDVASLTIVNTIPMQAGPHHMMASRDGRFLYVGEYNQNTVGVIDTSTDTAIAHYVTSPNVGSKTHAVFVSRDGNTLYATNFATKELVVLDAHSGAVLWRLPFDGSPSEAFLSKDGETAYVSIRSRNAVAVVDLKSRTVVAEPFIGVEPDTLQLTPNGKELVVALRGTPAEISLLDTRTLGVRFIDLAGATTGHEWLTPNGRYSFVAVEGPGSLAIVDNRTGLTAATYPYPGSGKPHGVFFEPSDEEDGASSAD
jgi:YVTN family beta-propeller protein